MLFKCKWTGNLLSAPRVRRTRAHFVAANGRSRAIFFPQDPATWDDRLLEMAEVERVPDPEAPKKRRSKRSKK